MLEMTESCLLLPGPETRQFSRPRALPPSVIAHHVLKLELISDLCSTGNIYTIANISQRDAYIFFAQSRKVLDDSEEPPPLPQRESIGGSKARAKVVQKKG